MKSERDFKLQHAHAVTRRQFFGRAGLGLGSIALSALLNEGVAAQSPTPNAQRPHHPAKAKSVIYLHMAGSPSQIDLFENKPELAKFDGKDCPEEFLKGKRFAFIKGVPKMLGPLFKYGQHGQSGQWISELLPHLASKVDRSEERRVGKECSS